MLIAILIVIAIVLWLFSTVGHALGLTPTFSELTDRPDGWVGRHYRGVFWGYVLTVAALATVAVLAWLASRARSDDSSRAVQARGWLRTAGVWAFVLAAAIAFLPIGRKPGDTTSTAAAHEGNVPDVVGLSAAAARTRIEAASLIASFRDVPYDDDRCMVFDQRPPADARLADSAVVTLRCHERVPAVVGMKASRAQSRLLHHGFDAHYANEPADGGLGRCRVVAQSRTGATTPFATIGLRLRCAKPRPKPAPVPATAPPASSCDPSYSGACLKPDSSDYDCAGGSGDGPDYTGPVTVVGDDHYDLDRDGDGSACE